MTQAAERQEPTYTIDELSAVAGVPSRTIRFYQSRGALPRPQKRGRKAYYGPAHVERLRLIGELQDRGLQIRAIRTMLGRLDSGTGSVEEWLGLQDHLRRPWTEDEPQLLNEDELKELLNGSKPGLLGALLRLGHVEQQGHQFLIQSPALFAQALRLDKTGFDVDTACEAADTLKKHLSKAAQELSRQFIDAVREKLSEDRTPEQVLEMVDTLKAIAPDAARVIFGHEIQAALGDLLSEGKL